MAKKLKTIISRATVVTRNVCSSSGSKDALDVRGRKLGLGLGLGMCGGESGFRVCTFRSVCFDFKNSLTETDVVVMIF